MSLLTVAHPVTGKPLPPFLTARETADLLGRTKEWVAAACARGELPHLPHIGNAPWAIPTRQLLRIAGFDISDRPVHDGLTQATYSPESPPCVVATASQDMDGGPVGRGSTKKGRAA